MSRRRSQRKAIAVPLKVEWPTDSGTVSVGGETELISAHGALLRLKTRNRVPKRLVVKNLDTGQSSEATLLYSVEPGKGAALSLAISLDTPGELFWGEVAPPAS
jgi:hypothetical protein